MFKQQVVDNQTVLIIDDKIVCYRILNPDEIFIIEGNMLKIYHIYSHKIILEEFISDLVDKSNDVKTLKKKI